jgi:hypothetical protein
VSACRAHRTLHFSRRASTCDRAAPRALEPRHARLARAVRCVPPLGSSTRVALCRRTGARPRRPAGAAGLHDAHTHPQQTCTCAWLVGATSVQVSLAGCESVEAMVEAVSSHAAKHPELSWVVGIGWDQSRWGRYPSQKIDHLGGSTTTTTIITNPAGSSGAVRQARGTLDAG